MQALAIFMQYPWAALIVAAAFATLWRYRRRRWSAMVAIFWGGYAVYEYLMHARILCSGECNIRVDLLLLYPFLLLISLWAVIVSFLGEKSPSIK